MSDKRSPRREAARKPTLHAIHYWQEKSKQQASIASEEEIREVRSIEAEPTSPAAWTRVIDAEIKRAL